MSIEEYTEAQFFDLVEKIVAVNVDDEKEHSNMVRQFCELVEHPDGSDLIYYPKNEGEDTPEHIVQTVKKMAVLARVTLF